MRVPPLSICLSVCVYTRPNAPRRENWSLPLCQTLLLLREVSQRLRLPAEHITYCMELCGVLGSLTDTDLEVGWVVATQCRTTQCSGS